MPKIEFQNKTDWKISPRPRPNKVVADDLNEIKASVNWLYDNFPDGEGGFLGPSVKLRRVGAVGDGETDDTDAVQSAINTYNQLDGEGLTYKISQKLVGKANFSIKNAQFICDTNENDDAFIFEGQELPPITLPVDVTSGSVTIQVPDGSQFEVDQFIYISSDDDFSSDAKNGELLKIKSVDDDIISLYGAVLLDYTTSKNAIVTRLVMLKNIFLENFKIVGQNIDGNRTGIRFRVCSDVLLDNIQSEQFQYSHIVFDRCAFSEVRSGYASKTGTSVGLNYGVTILNASYGIKVNGYSGDSMRHLVTIGGSQGVSRWISVVNSKAFNITDAGIDAHSSVHEHTFDSNMIHFSTGGSSMDGIISQGSSPIITNNQLFGVKREGILWQPLQKNTFVGGLSAIIANNRAVNASDTGTHNGVLVSTEPSGSDWASIDSVIISNFQGAGFLNNVQILARNAEIRKVIISNSVTLKPMRGRSILAKCTNASIDQIQVIGGYHETNSDSTNPVIEFEGTEAFPVKNWNVAGCVWKRSNTGVGLRLLWTSVGWETANLDIGISTKILVQNSTGQILDTRGGTNFNHITQTANHAGVFQASPQHAWDMGGSANIPYNFAYRINGERTLQKDGTSKDIFIGQVDAITGETGRVILRARGQNSAFFIDGGNAGFGGAPSGANYHFHGNLRIGTVANASGDFATYSGSNVLQKRTPTQVKSDLGIINFAEVYAQTTDPMVAGQLWNNGGVLTFSTGGT